MLAACTSTETSDDKITKAFKEYVKTDFGNPSDFIDITKFDDKDTISNQTMFKSVCLLDSLTWIMSTKQQRRYEMIKNILQKDSFSIVQHKIKVRVRAGNEGYTVNDYYIIEQDGNYTVQDHAATNEELPSICADVLDMLSEVLERMKSFNRSMYYD